MEENKEALTYITRLGLNKIDDTFRHKIYISYCLKDKDLIIDIAREFLKLENVMVCWINPNNYGLVNKEELDSILNEMQLAVYLVSDNYVKEENNFSYEYEYKYFRRKKTSALPILLDETIIDEYTRKFGTIQYLIKDDNSVDFKQRLESFLKMHLIDEKLYKNATKAFDKRLFLSYRKIDKELVNELLDAIHKNKNCHDIAIWYDDFLIPGVRFDQLIEKQLSNSSAFLLLTTPNINVGDNYIKTVEYPIAKKLEKTIFPVVVNNLDVDEKEINRNYKDFPKLISVNDIAEEVNKFFNNDKYKVSKKNKFYMGLAYLYGINVERNNELAVSFISESSDEGNLAAKEFLAKMYQVGNGVTIDYEKAFALREELLSTLRKKLDFSKWDESDNQYWNVVFDLIDSYTSAREKSEKIAAFFKHQQELITKYGISESEISEIDDLNALRVFLNFFLKYLDFLETRQDNDTIFACLDVIAVVVDEIEKYKDLSFDDIEALFRTYLKVYLYYKDEVFTKEDFIDKLELLKRIDFERSIQVFANAIINPNFYTFIADKNIFSEIFDIGKEYFEEIIHNKALLSCYKEEKDIILAFIIFLSVYVKSYSPAQSDIDYLKSFVKENAKKKKYMYLVNAISSAFGFKEGRLEIDKQLSESTYDDDITSYGLKLFKEIKELGNILINEKYDEIIGTIKKIKSTKEYDILKEGYDDLVSYILDITYLCKNEKDDDSKIDDIFRKTSMIFNEDLTANVLVKLVLSLPFIQRIIELKIRNIINNSNSRIVDLLEEDIAFIKNIKDKEIAEYLLATYLFRINVNFAIHNTGEKEVDDVIDFIKSISKECLEYFKTIDNDSIAYMLLKEAEINLILSFFISCRLDLKEYEGHYAYVRQLLIKHSKLINNSEVKSYSEIAALLRIFYLENSDDNSILKLYDSYASLMNILINDSKPIIEMDKNLIVAFYAISGANILSKGNYRVAANIAKQINSLEINYFKIIEYIYQYKNLLFYSNKENKLLEEVMINDVSNVTMFLATFSNPNLMGTILFTNPLDAAIKWGNYNLLENIHRNILTGSLMLSPAEKATIEFLVLIEGVFNDNIIEFESKFQMVEERREFVTDYIPSFSRLFSLLRKAEVDKKHIDVFDKILNYMVDSSILSLGDFFKDYSRYAVSFLSILKNFFMNVFYYFYSIDKDKAIRKCGEFIKVLEDGNKNANVSLNDIFKYEYNEILYSLYFRSAFTKFDLGDYEGAYNDYVIQKDYYKKSQVFTAYFSQCLTKLKKLDELNDLLSNYFTMWNKDVIRLVDDDYNVGLLESYSSLEIINDGEHNRKNFYHALSIEKHVYLSNIIRNRIDVEKEYLDYPKYSSEIIDELVFRKQYSKAKEYLDRRFEVLNKLFPVNNHKELYSKMYQDYSKIYSYLGDEDKAYEYHLLSKTN